MKQPLRLEQKELMAQLLENLRIIEAQPLLTPASREKLKVAICRLEEKVKSISSVDVL